LQSALRGFDRFGKSPGLGVDGGEGGKNDQVLSTGKPIRLAG